MPPAGSSSTGPDRRWVRSCAAGSGSSDDCYAARMRAGLEGQPSRCRLHRMVGGQELEEGSPSSGVSPDPVMADPPAIAQGTARRCRRDGRQSPVTISMRVATQTTYMAPARNLAYRAWVQPSDGRLPEGGDWQDHEQADLPDRASWMFTASLDSEVTKVTGPMMRCHRLSEKPATTPSLPACGFAPAGTR